MADKLKYSPLIEALCEFRFAAPSSWDWTIPGRLYDEIKEEFSERSQVDGLTFQLAPGPNQAPAQAIAKGPERVQLKRPDGSAMIQVGPHLLVINHLRPYADWEKFRSMILDAFAKHEKITGPAKIVRIGLRYINQIPLPTEDCQLSEFTTLEPRLTGALDRPLYAMYQRFELEQEKPKSTLIVQAGHQRTPQGNFLMLDFDLGSRPDDDFSDTANVVAWMNEAHDRIDEAFLAAVNPARIAKWKRGET